ncbi:MAG: hypothetical protein Q9223_007307 [Gallowayella weberi]
MAADLQASLDPDWVPHPNVAVANKTTATPHLVRDDSCSPSNTSLDPIRMNNHFDARQSLGDDPREGDSDPPAQEPERLQRSSTEADDEPLPLPHPEAPQFSRLPLKIRDQTEKSFQLDATGAKKGFTRVENGELEYLHQGDWKKAVYHYRIRGKLLRMMDAKGQYKEEPERGWSLFDRTAFKSDQRFWQMKERSKRPDCLFLWEDPNQSPNYTPQYWYDEGRIVLGSDGRPVKMWRELPLTISGQCEGFRIEAWRRLNPNIKVRDIVARMPKLTSKGKKLMYKDIKIPALANRCTRDRCRAGIKAWNPRDGSRVKERRLMQMIPLEVQKQIVGENSTRCFRDLTDAEIAYVEVGNKGTAASLRKAGARMLTIEERQKRADKKEKRATNLNKQSDLGCLQIHPVLEDAISKPGLNRVRRGDSAAPDSFSMKRERSEDPEDTDPNADGQDRRKKRRHFPNDSFGLPSVQNAAHNQFLATFEGFNDFDLGVPQNPENWRQHQLYTRTDHRSVQEPEEVTQQNSNIADNTSFPHNNYRSGPDLRLKTPTTTEEQNLIQEALQITHDDYHHHLGVPSPQLTTEKTESYAYQLNCIQASFNRAFDGSNSILPFPPLLRYHGFWTDSMDGFRRLPTARRQPQYEDVERGDDDTLPDSSIADWESATPLGGLEQLEVYGSQYLDDSMYGDTLSGFS